MGRIADYIEDSVPTPEDKLIGTDVDSLDQTKNYLISDILALGNGAQGPVGPQGPVGATGATGPAGADASEAFIQKDDNYTLTNDDRNIEAITNAGKTYTLPTAVGIKGQRFTVLSSIAGATTVDTTGIETISGEATKTLALNESITVVSNGADYLEVLPIQPALTDIQDAYDNSADGTVTTDLTRTALKVKRGTAVDTDNVLEVLAGVGTVNMSVDGTGKMVTDTQTIRGLTQYANDAAAGAGGLTIGDVYQTSGAGAAPLNAAGILMIKQ